MTNYRRRKPQVKPQTKRFNVNNQITAEEVRIIDEEGEMVGVYKRNEALKLAEERELDLIEINPKAVPSVAKLMEYTKFKYQQDKAEKTKPKVNTDAKVLRVKVSISLNDLKVRAKKADEFLSKGLKVKLQVQMRGRERQYPDVAKDVMVQFIDAITEPFDFETEPKLVGDSSFCTIKAK